MNATPQNISAMTDISANIFAVLILILIIMLVARENSSAPRTPEIIDVEKDAVGIERVPLGSDELFDLLYERRDGSASTKLDLLSRGIDVISGGKTEHFGSVDSALSRLSQGSGFAGTPIGVYVFSHRFYRGVTNGLKNRGLVWREVSVPQALRNSSATMEDQGWSGGFSELIARPSDRAQFRNELAQLLQSSSAEGHSNQDWRGANGPAGQRPALAIDRLVRWSCVAIDALSILIGLIFVGWVETRGGLNRS